MQAYRFDEVLKKTSKKNDLDFDLLKSFSDHIFSTAKQEMTKFEDLRITLKGLITFFYGKTRLEKFMVKLDDKIDCLKKEIPQKHKMYFLEKMDEAQLEQLKTKTIALHEVYEQFVKERREVKTAFKEAKKLKLGGGDI